jgi:hypothetical protein
MMLMKLRLIWFLLPGLSRRLMLRLFLLHILGLAKQVP